MFQRLTNFVKYHNAFPIALSVILLSSGAVFAASPQARDAVISESTTVRSVDNSYIINVDLGSYNPQLLITSVKEDDSNYYVSYTYNIISIDDYVWKKYKTNETLTVSKKALGNKDLGLYVAKEISEVMNNEDVYLNKVQNIEKNKGITKKVATTEYSGLVGKMLSPKVEEFDGYVPVIPEEKPIVNVVKDNKSSQIASMASNNISTQTTQPEVVITMPSKEEIKKIIQDTVRELLAEEDTTTTTVTTIPTTTSTTTPPTTNSDTTPPIITITGNNPANIDVNSSYVDLGAIVTDNVNDNLGISYKVNGTTVSNINLDTSTDTTYTITYSATDQVGNTGTATRTVIVGTGVTATTTQSTTTTTATTTPDTTTSTATTTTTSTSTASTTATGTATTTTSTTTPDVVVQNETASTTTNTATSTSTQ